MSESARINQIRNFISIRFRNHKYNDEILSNSNRYVRDTFYICQNLLVLTKLEISLLLVSYKNYKSDLVSYL